MNNTNLEHREYIDSPILGKVLVANDEERKEIADLIKVHELTVFQELNKHFNSKGLMINIVKVSVINDG